MAEKKTGTKTKAKVESKEATGQVTKAASKIARQEVVREGLTEAKKLIETNYVNLSNLLSEAYHKEFYLDWGFSDFQAYCDTELDVKYRKAMYLVETWDKTKALKIPEKRMIELGWTKMKDLVQVMTDKNKAEWMKKAKDMSSRELTEAVKITRRRDSGEVPSDVPMVTTMTLKMSESENNIIMEAIDEAKQVSGNDNAVVALEMICQDWMEQQGGDRKISLEDNIQYLEKVYGVDLSYKAKSTKEVNEGEALLNDVKNGNKVAKPRSEPLPESDELSSLDDGVDISDLLGED